MDFPRIDMVAQGLGRLANQYAGATKFRALLTGLLQAGGNLQDSARAFGDLIDPTTATGAFLDFAGWLVGAARRLPDGTNLGDAGYRILVLAKIARNQCKGTVPSMREQLTRLFDPAGRGTSIQVDDLGGMSMRVQIGRALTAEEKNVLTIASGISRIPGGILPRPMGVSLTVSERVDSDFFCFSSVTAPGVPTIAGGRGFGSVGSPSGHWAGVI